MTGTWPIRHQFQFSELLKVVDRHCSFGLNMRRLSEDAVLMKSADKCYSPDSPVSLRIFTVLALI